MGKRKERKERAQYHLDLLATVDRVFKDTKSERDKMDHAKKLYEGELWDLNADEFQNWKQVDGPSTVQFNSFFANVQQIAPMVTANRPIPMVAPRYPWMWKLGEQLNHVIKYAWDHLDMQMLSFKAVIDSMRYGIAIFHLDYREEGPVIELIDPRDFFIAPGYDEIWKAPWCGVRAPKPVSWVKRNFPGVRDIITDDGDSNDTNDSDDHSKAYKYGNTTNPSDDTKFVTVNSIWIKDEEALEEFSEEEDGKKVTKKRKKFLYGKMCYFSEAQWFDEIALEDEHGKPPWVEMWNYIRPHNFLAMSEIDQTEGLHNEINVLIKYISEYVRIHHAPNLLADISRLPDNTLEELKARLSLGNQVIPWDSSGDAAPPITQIDQGTLDGMVSQWLAMLMELIDIISGVTDPQRGMVGKKERQPATETAILKEAADTRVMQRSRNLEWTLKRVFKILLQLTMQYQDSPKQMSYEEGGNRVYSTYGNSYAQAREAMEPTPMNESAQTARDEGIPPTGTNEGEQKRYEQEQADLDKFLAYFAVKGDNGEMVPPKDFDPITYAFDVTIETDSTLPKDRQSRSNLFLRLRQMKSIDILSLYEELQIPGAEEKTKRLKEEMGQGQDQQQQQMAANPEAAAKYKQEQAARSGQNG